MPKMQLPARGGRFAYRSLLYIIEASYRTHDPHRESKFADVNRDSPRRRQTRGPVREPLAMQLSANGRSPLRGPPAPPIMSAVGSVKSPLTRRFGGRGHSEEI